MCMHNVATPETSDDEFASILAKQRRQPRCRLPCGAQTRVATVQTHCVLLDVDTYVRRTRAGCGSAGDESDATTSGAAHQRGTGSRRNEPPRAPRAPVPLRQSIGRERIRTVKTEVLVEATGARNAHGTLVWPAAVGRVWLWPVPRATNRNRNCHTPHGPRQSARQPQPQRDGELTAWCCSVACCVLDGRREER